MRSRGFFSVQLRLGNECDFHGMLELARKVFMNLWECWGNQDVPRKSALCCPTLALHRVGLKGYGSGCCFAGPVQPGGSQCSCRE